MTKTNETLQVKYEQAINSIKDRGYGQLGVANEIYSRAQKLGAELKLTPKNLQVLKADYKLQLEARARGWVYSVGWDGCPEALEQFAKDKKGLESILQETLVETCKEQNGFIKEQIITYAKSRALSIK